jgi:hypothetical protein
MCRLLEFVDFAREKVPFRPERREFGLARLVQRVELSGRTLGGRARLDLDELVLLEPQEDGVDRAFDHVCEAESAQGRCDFVTVGFTAIDDLEHATLEYAFKHFREVFQGDASFLDK